MLLTTRAEGRLAAFATEDLPETAGAGDEVTVQLELMRLERQLLASPSAIGVAEAVSAYVGRLL